MPTRRRWRKRWLFGALAAIILITWPVLPLNPMTLFNQNNLNINNIREWIAVNLEKALGLSDTKERRERTEYGLTASVPTEDIRPLTFAVEQLERQLERFPNDPSVHNRIGILYAQIGEFTAAKQHFNIAVDLCHQQMAALASKARAWNHNDTASQAESPALVSSELNLQLSAAHSNLARIYDKIGQHDRVVAQLDQLNRDVAFAGQFASPRKPTFIANADRDAAIVNTHKINSLTATSLARAQALLQAGNVQEAVREYQSLLRVDPQIAIAHQQLGLVAVRMNDLQLAITEFQAAANLDPDDANTHNNLGRAYLARGDDALAEGEFARACTLDPKNIEAAINYSNVLAGKSRYDEAIQTLQKSLSFNPNSAVGHNNLASLLSVTGRNKEAVGEYQAAINLKPDMATAHYGLGLSLFNMQSYQGAIKELKAALNLNPNLTDAHSKLEQAYRKSELAVSSAAGIN